MSQFVKSNVQKRQRSDNVNSNISGKYIHKLTERQRQVLGSRTPDSCDVGLSNILMFCAMLGDAVTCQDEETLTAHEKVNQRRFLRYSTQQRRHASGYKHFVRRWREYKNVLIEISHLNGDGTSTQWTVGDWETWLAQAPPCKSVNVAQFYEYLAAKIATNHSLHDNYNNRVYRRIKFYQHRNRERSEAHLLQKSKSAFGGYDKCFLVMVCFLTSFYVPQSAHNNSLD